MIDQQHHNAISTSPVSVAQAKAFAIEVEAAIIEIANGRRKPGRLPLEPVARLIQFARDASEPSPWDFPSRAAATAAPMDTGDLPYNARRLVDVDGECVVTTVRGRVFYLPRADATLLYEALGAVIAPSGGVVDAQAVGVAA